MLSIKILKGNATYPAAEFTGVNRAEESVSEYVETLITRKQVPLADAQAILDLLLCNETGVVINLASKNKAETLGIAKDILDLIPWDGKAYQNSEQGKMPQSFWAWLGTQIAGFFLAILNFFIWLGSLIIAIGLWIIGLFATAVMAAIEAAVKAIILIYVYLMLAITFLGLMLGFLTLITFLLVLTANNPGVLTFGFLWYELHFSSTTVRTEVSLVFIHSSFIDLTIPCLKIATYKDQQQNFALIYSFGIPIDSVIEIPKSSTSGSEPQKSSSLGNPESQIQISNEEVTHTYYMEGLIDALVLQLIVSFIMIACTGFYSLINYIVCALIAFFFLMIILNNGQLSPEDEKDYLIGYGFGLVQAGLGIMAPTFVGNVVVDTIIWVPLTMFIAYLIKVGFNIGYPDDPDYTVASLAIGELGAVLFNVFVENDTFKKLCWWALSFVLVFLGIAIVICAAYGL